MNKPIKLRGHHILGYFDYVLWADRKPLWDPFLMDRLSKYGDAFIENKRKIFGKLYISLPECNNAAFAYT